MISKAYNKSEIARRYFELKGETLTRQEANNRWKMIRSPDLLALKKVFDTIHKEQKGMLKKKKPG
jgi:hypothetical protein